jgi:hypothetical protein
MLFPGDKLSNQIAVTINKADIEVIKNATPNFFSPVIMVFVEYKFTFEPGSHLTYVTFDLLKKPHNTFTADDAAVPLDALILERRMFDAGNSYAD